MNLPLRHDEYGIVFYAQINGEVFYHPLCENFNLCGIDFSTRFAEKNGVFELRVRFQSEEKVYLEKLGMRLGIDAYMDKYPDWLDKFFPTAIRCEKTGFWSCFCSPNGKMLSVCSKEKIASWKNEYNKTKYGSLTDVGHRIYTSSAEFINTYKNPERHPESEKFVREQKEYTFYYSYVKNFNGLSDFVKKYAGIILPRIEKYTFEPWESAEISGKKFELESGYNLFDFENTAQIGLYKRKEWFYYIECAAKNAEKCQQKGGSHCEAWYGYFTMCLYAGLINDALYTDKLCRQFDEFFENVTENTLCGVRFKRRALPERLQNISSMVSLLSDFYELSGNEKYLKNACDMADALLETQDVSGGYMWGKSHYTCVIYPIKSLLELYSTLKKAGKNADRYYESAKLAAADLYRRKDDIGTEGEQTFEDGMITCEALQLSLFALETDNEDWRRKLTDLSEALMKKHRALEQNILPDCRMRGATLRFWEARYDLNFFANMLSTPHGWTSWKVYAVYYIYLLTGKKEYLRDLFDTVGACMQCVGENGELYWGFIADPCVTGRSLKINSSKKAEFEIKTVGEEYLPMISHWYKQEKDALICQYIKNPDDEKSLKEDYGGSCDNDVHEHFKALCETVFGKAFIHETDSGYICYNCKICASGFSSDDKFVNTIIYFAKEKTDFVFGNKKYSAKKGINIIEK